jgi:hypothetical protein
MKNEHGNHVVQGLATKRADGTGYIVVLDAADLVDWLRCDEHDLSEAEFSLLHELADQIDTWAMAVLDQELEANPQP